MFSLPELPQINKNHQLSNEGCLCEFCQKLNMTENMVQSLFFFIDRESEHYEPFHHKQTYLDLLDELMEWEKKCNRKLRFSLPEICVFFGGMPVHFITKPKDNSPVKLIRHKSKLNIFELHHFFLDGYLQHMPEVVNKKREKHEFKEKMRQVCTIAAKYSKNVTALLTFDQLASMFKSKFKYMREDLMYLQTLVGGHHSAEHTIKIDLSVLETENSGLFERAKLQASIFSGSIKIIDPEYYPEKNQIQFQDKLRRQNRQQYLTYLSLKIIFISSKFKPNIMKESIFKWSCVKDNDFLWDVRVMEYDKSSSYWQSSVMQALEVKLKKTMSMLQFGPDSQLINKNKLSSKAQELNQWLEKSTENEWNQMKLISSRLDKLQSQKKALMESQKHGMNRFRTKNLRKRDSLHQSFNPEL